jgi:hypothetical protein
VSSRLPDDPNHDEAAPAWFLDGSACPPWCARGHMRAFQEGASLERACEHVGRGNAGYLPEIGDGRVTRPGGGAWELVPVQEAAPDGEQTSGAAVEMELRDGGPDPARVRLTSGEARVLAAQLAHSADQLDLFV